MDEVTRSLTIDQLQMAVIRESNLAYMFKAFSNINNTVKSIEIAVDRYVQDNEEFSKSHFIKWLTGQLEGCGRMIRTVDYEDLPSYDQKKFSWFDDFDKYLYTNIY